MKTFVTFNSSVRFTQANKIRNSFFRFAHFSGTMLAESQTFGLKFHRLYVHFSNFLIFSPLKGILITLRLFLVLFRFVC